MVEQFESMRGECLPGKSGVDGVPSRLGGREKGTEEEDESIHLKFRNKPKAIGMHHELVNYMKGEGLVITKVWEKGSSGLGTQ